MHWNSKRHWDWVQGSLCLLWGNSGWWLKKNKKHLWSCTIFKSDFTQTRSAILVLCFFNNVLKCPCSNKLRQFQAPLCRSQEGRGGLKIEPISSTLCKHTPYRLPWRQSDVKVNSNSKKRNCSGAVLSEKNWRETLIYKHFMNRLYHYSFVFAPGAPVTVLKPLSCRPPLRRVPWCPVFEDCSTGSCSSTGRCRRRCGTAARGISSSITVHTTRSQAAQEGPGSPQEW